MVFFEILKVRIRLVLGSAGLLCTVVTMVWHTNTNMKSIVCVYIHVVTTASFYNIVYTYYTGKLRLWAIQPPVHCIWSTRWTYRKWQKASLLWGSILISSECSHLLIQHFQQELINYKTKIQYYDYIIHHCN